MEKIHCKKSTSNSVDEWRILVKEISKRKQEGNPLETVKKPVRKQYRNNTET